MRHQLAEYWQDCLNGTHQAACTCGWRSNWLQNASRVEKQFNEHAVDAFVKLDTNRVWRNKVYAPRKGGAA